MSADLEDAGAYEVVVGGVEVDAKAMTGMRCLRRLDCHVRGDRVDAVAAQCDLDRAGVRFECERAGRLFVELVGLEHDQDSAVRAGRAEPGARGGSVECRHMQHVPGGAAELHGPEVDRRGRRAGNEQDSRQQRGSAHTGSVLRRQNLPVRGRRLCGSPLSVGRFGPTMGDARVCTSLTADSPRRRLVARRGQVRLALPGPPQMRG